MCLIYHNTYRRGYYINMYRVGYTNCISYCGFFSETSLEADPKILRFACRFFREISGEHLLSGKSGDSKGWQREKVEL